MSLFWCFILDHLSEYIIFTLGAFLVKGNVGIVSVTYSASKDFILFVVFAGRSHRGTLMLLSPALRAKYRGQNNLLCI